MKSRNYIITTIVAAAALFSACSLEEDLSPISTPDNYFRSKAECESVVNSCYIPMKSYYNYTFMIATECCTDIAYCPSGTLDARLDISPATPRHGQTVWTQCYLGVQRCNFAINGIEKSKAFIDKDTHEIDEKNSDRIRLLCEAKVLRSFYYYTLTSFFGDVPFYFDDVEDLATLDSLAVLPRMDARKTREACIRDLQGIAPLASQTRTSDNKEHRLGAATAYMLIAKMAMWNQDWHTALEALGHIEDIYGDFSQYDYAENVMFRNKNTPESIMEIQHTYTQGGTVYTSNVACICMPTPRSGDYYDGIQVSELGSQATAWAAMRPNVIFCQGLQSKMSKDIRKNYNMAWSYDGHDFKNVNTRPWCGPKFWCPNMYQTSDGNNYKIFRYADAILMMAECYNELEQDDKAVEYLNKTRNRAGLADYVYRSHVRLQTEIRNERARELFGEFQRKFDLVRWGIWYEETLANNNWDRVIENILPCHRFYPIPEQEVIKSKYALDNKEYEKYGL